MKVTIPRELLDTIPVEERDFIVLLGYVTNQINMLNKLLLVAGKRPLAQGVEELGRTTQLGIVLRLLAGQANEAWELVQTHFSRSKLSRDYVPALSPDGAAALARLKAYFSGSNLVNKVRNSYAYHVPKEQLSNALNTDSEPLEFFFSESRGCCLYWSSEMLAMWDLMEKAGDGDHAAGSDRLYGEIATMAHDFLIFADSCLFVFATNIGLQSDSVLKETFVVDRPPDIESMDLPFLVGTNRGRRLNA